MSKSFNFDQTSIPTQFSINLKDNFGIIVSEVYSADIYRTLFMSIATFLRVNQEAKYHRIGMSMKDSHGAFKIGAIMTFNPPEEGSEEDSGNWFLEFTIYEDDMTDIDLELDNHNDVFIRCTAKAANDQMYGRFRSVDIMHNIFNTAVDTLVAFLDTNASEAEEVEVSLAGTFTAAVAVENGEKVISIVPGEIIKQCIKNDAALV